MRRIKVLIATVAVLAVMVMAAAPALAGHGYEWTDWWQWRNTDWWCTSLWYHDSHREWSLEMLVCWHPEEDLWVWP